jgi:hypothetical protein
VDEFYLRMQPLSRAYQKKKGKVYSRRRRLLYSYVLSVSTVLVGLYSNLVAIQERASVENGRRVELIKMLNKEL